MQTQHHRTRAHVFISGMVQGVNFRAYTRDQARRNGLAGWVRNLPDGRVEAVFEGEASAVERMVEWCHDGPPYARVEHVDVQWETATNAEEGFQVRR